MESVRPPSTFYIQPWLAQSYHTLLLNELQGIKSQADGAETGRQQRARHVKNTRSCHSQLSVYPGAVYQYTHKCQSHASAEVETGREIEKRREGGGGDTGNASQALGEHMSKGVSEGLHWSSVNFDFPQAYYLTQMSSQQHEGERREHNRETDRERGRERERNSSLGSCIY